MFYILPYGSKTNNEITVFYRTQNYRTLNNFRLLPYLRVMVSTIYVCTCSYVFIFYKCVCLFFLVRWLYVFYSYKGVFVCCCISFSLISLIFYTCLCLCCFLLISFSPFHVYIYICFFYFSMVSVCLSVSVFYAASLFHWCFFNLLWHSFSFEDFVYILKRWLSDSAVLIALGRAIHSFMVWKEKI